MSSQDIAPVADSRKLGPVLATVLVAGNMMGSGVYLLPATLGATGTISVAGWLAATLGALSLAAVFSFLAQVRPSTEGMVGYARMGLGAYVGFQSGVAYWISCWVGNVAIAVACVGYLAVLVPALAHPLPTVLATIGAVWLMILANIIGPRFVAKVGSLGLAVGLLPVLAVAVAGWFWFDPEVFAASWNVSGKTPVLAVAGTLAPIFWSFLGLESATVAAAVVRRPERNVPIAAIGGVAIAAAIYILATTAIGGLLPARVLEHSTGPFAMATTRMLGAAAGAVVAGCACLKAMGTLGGFTLLAAETGRASADFGDFPRFMGRVAANGAPVANLLLVGVLMTAVVLVSRSPTVAQQFGMLIDVATVLSLVVYAYCCITLLRFSGEASSPRRRLLARVCAGLALVFCCWVVGSSNPKLLAISAAVLLATGPIWPLARLRRR